MAGYKNYLMELRESETEEGPECEYHMALESAKEVLGETDGFYLSCKSFLERRGYLTEKQLAALRPHNRIQVQTSIDLGVVFANIDREQGR